MPDGRRNMFAFSSLTGQMITSEPLQHSAEIRCIRINQATSQSRARFGFINSNGDLTICRFVASNPRLPPSIETAKLANFVDEFEWHSTHDLLIARSGEKLAIYCGPSAAFFTAELMLMLRIELRLLFDAAGISAFNGSHAFIIAKDGANCVEPISPFLIMIHEAVLQGRVNEAEDILIQGGCIFRAVKMNISLGRLDKVLAIAKRTNKFVDVVAAYRTEFLKELDMEETDQNFIKISPVSMDSVKSIIQQEKVQEISG